ncbi:MAG: hypothetical protein E6H83_03085 [Chloroflexi bacterium]|nr:MAG: hypothetical protein E6H83_03085 [Chloroflexota bacterium]
MSKGPPRYVSRGCATGASASVRSGTILTGLAIILSFYDDSRAVRGATTRGATPVSAPSTHTTAMDKNA